MIVKNHSWFTAMNIKKLRDKYNLNDDDENFVREVISDAKSILTYCDNKMAAIELWSLVDTIARLKSANSRLTSEKLALKSEIVDLHQQQNPFLVDHYKVESKLSQNSVQNLQNKISSLEGELKEKNSELAVMQYNSKRRRNRVFNRGMCRNYGPFTYAFRAGQPPKQIMENCNLSRSTYYRYQKLIKEVDELKAAGKLDRMGFKYNRADYIERLYAAVVDAAKGKNVSAEEVWEDHFKELPIKQRVKALQKKTTKPRKASKNISVRQEKLWDVFLAAKASMNELKKTEDNKENPL